MASSADSSGHYRLGIVAGETSGDNLGSALMDALAKYPVTIEYTGIGGPGMIDRGCRSLFRMDEISIVGLDGLFGNIRRILSIRRELARRLIENGTDLFVGIDVPDFNLGLEKMLKKASISVAHYVSPTIWAWRGYRIHRIRRVVDHMITLFPFEADIYRKHQVPVTCVGHPLVDDMKEPDSAAARCALGLAGSDRIVGILPGSRRSEIDRLTLPFLEAARIITGKHPGTRFVLPFATPAVRKRFEEVAGDLANAIDLITVDGNARRVMEASDVLLVASGTAALEAALIATPMVVAYRLSPTGYRMAKLVSHTNYFSMPNILMPEPLVPEMIQGRANARALAREVLKLMEEPELAHRQVVALESMKASLRGGASEAAASVVMNMLQRDSAGSPRG